MGSVNFARFEFAGEDREDLTLTLTLTLVLTLTGEDREDLERADGLLFSTGWGIAHEAALMPGGKPEALLLTSASSRTALAAAFSAKHGDGLARPTHENGAFI